MSISHAKSHTESQRPSRNWVADTIVVAGIVAFGYFALTIESSRQQALSSTEQPATTPLDLLRAR